MFSSQALPLSLLTLVQPPPKAAMVQAIPSTLVELLLSSSRSIRGRSPLPCPSDKLTQTSSTPSDVAKVGSETRFAQSRRLPIALGGLSSSYIRAFCLRLSLHLRRTALLSNRSHAGAQFRPEPLTFCGFRKRCCGTAVLDPIDN